MAIFDQVIPNGSSPSCDVIMDCSSAASNSTAPLGADLAEVRIRIVDIEKRAAGINKTSWNGWGMFIGIAYSFVICYMLGKYPQHFWLVYFASFGVLAPLNFVALRKRNQQGAFKEFCWYANIIGNLAVVVAIMYLRLRDQGEYDEENASTMLPKLMFTLAWAPATGVLAIMALVNGNQLSFNHLPTIAETFIHLFPTLVMYTMRWESEKLIATHPWFFDFQYLSSITNLDIFAATVCLYAPWWFLYMSWAMTCGIWSSPDKTFFHQQMRMVRSLPFRALYSQQEHPVRLDVFLYMLGHAVWVLALSSVAMLAFHIKDFHVFLNGIAILRVTLLGGLRYGHVLAYYEAIKSFGPLDGSETDFMA